MKALLYFESESDSEEVESPVRSNSLNIEEEQVENFKIYK